MAKRKDPGAVRLGRKGGIARAKKLTEKERKEAAKKAGLASARARGSTGLAKAGVKGGTARAAALTPEQRKEIARKAIAARWAKKKGLPA